MRDFSNLAVSSGVSFIPSAANARRPQKGVRASGAAEGEKRPLYGASSPYPEDI